MDHRACPARDLGNGTETQNLLKLRVGWSATYNKAGRLTRRFVVPGLRPDVSMQSLCKPDHLASAAVAKARAGLGLPTKLAERCHHDAVDKLSKTRPSTKPLVHDVIVPAPSLR